MQFIPTHPNAGTQAPINRAPDPKNLRTRGILYCYKLMQQGIPYSEARSIASAIAKFDVLQRDPSAKQKQLIMKNSARVCRAHLWRSNLLLSIKKSNVF